MSSCLRTPLTRSAAAEFGPLANVVLFHAITCEQPPTGYVRVSVVLWFWSYRPHVVKRIYPSRSPEEELDEVQLKRKERTWEHERTWYAQFARLEAYKEAQGGCNVPQGWVEDPTLAGWVNT